MARKDIGSMTWRRIPVQPEFSCLQPDSFTMMQVPMIRARKVVIGHQLHPQNIIRRGIRLLEPIAWIHVVETDFQYVVSQSNI